MKRTTPSSLFWARSNVVVQDTYCAFVVWLFFKMLHINTSRMCIGELPSPGTCMQGVENATSVSASGNHCRGWLSESDTRVVRACFAARKVSRLWVGLHFLKRWDYKLLPGWMHAARSMQFWYVSDCVWLRPGVVGWRDLALNTIKAINQQASNETVITGQWG